MVFKLQDSEKIGDFSSLILLPGWNYKIRNIIADLQDIPNLIKEYHLSTILKVESRYDPRGHNENSEFILHICKMCQITF